MHGLNEMESNGLSATGEPEKKPSMPRHSFRYFFHPASTTLARLWSLDHPTDPTT